MKVSNPLTIIAIFSGTAEAFATVALIALPLEIQSLFIYFVMLFPLIIVITFFLILVFKPHVLYAPSDFDNQQHFLELNKLRSTLETVTEKAIKEASVNGESLDPKEMSKVIVKLAIKKLGDDLTEKVYEYLKEHPNHTFSTTDLSNRLSESRGDVLMSLYYLAGTSLVSLIKKGRNVDSIVWQIKT